MTAESIRVVPADVSAVVARENPPITNRPQTQWEYISADLPNIPINGDELSPKKPIVDNNDWAPFPNPAQDSGRTE